MSIKEKPSSMQKGLDLFYTYKILKDLVTPFDEMYPFKLGLIDGIGNADQILRDKYGEKIVIKKFEKAKGCLARKLS